MPPVVKDYWRDSAARESNPALPGSQPDAQPLGLLSTACEDLNLGEGGYSLPPDHSATRVSDGAQYLAARNRTLANRTNDGRSTINLQRSRTLLGAGVGHPGD